MWFLPRRRKIWWTWKSIYFCVGAGIFSSLQFQSRVCFSQEPCLSRRFRGRKELAKFPLSNFWKCLIELLNSCIPALARALYQYEEYILINVYLIYIWKWNCKTRISNLWDNNGKYCCLNWTLRVLRLLVAFIRLNFDKKKKIRH